MTVSTTTSRADYTGNGVTVAFSVPFYFLDATHLTVLRTVVATGVSTTLVLGSDYTVTGAGVPAGGTVTCTVAPTAAQKLSILRNVPLTQLTDYVPNDPFPAESHERALDQLTMEVQQVNEALSRAITYPSSDAAAVTTQLPTAALRASKVLVFDAAGAPGVSDVASLASVTATAYVNVQEFTGDGTTAAYTLTSVPGSSGMVEVSVGGITQSPTADYSVAGNTLTFVAAPPNGQRIIARWLTSSGTPGVYVPISSTQGSTSEVRANGRILVVQGVGNGTSGGPVETFFGFSGVSSNTFGLFRDVSMANGTVAAPTATSAISGFEFSSYKGHDGSTNVQGALFRVRAAGAPSAGSVPMEMSWGIGSSSTASNVVLRSGGQWRFVPMASAPASPLQGDTYYDSTLNKLRTYDGTTWNNLW